MFKALKSLKSGEVSETNADDADLSYTVIQRQLVWHRVL